MMSVRSSTSVRCGFLATERSDDLIGAIQKQLSLGGRKDASIHKGIHLVDEGPQLIERRVDVALVELPNRCLQFSDQGIALALIQHARRYESIHFVNEVFDLFLWREDYFRQKGVSETATVGRLQGVCGREVGR